MSDCIQILPRDVASQIAAGEVVNRPASVVKELVENSIDAGSTQIRINLLDAGRTSIQIIDNGCGMSPADSVVAFERHATSKIRQSDDLYSLSTFGFRGEALASIAAVAEVELRTRQKGDETGTRVVVKASEIVSSEPDICPEGTNLTVKNLFYNVPARRRFLKSNQTEFGHVMTEIERVALAHPEVAIDLTHQGDTVLSLPASPIKQRIVNLFGKKMNQALLPVEVETSIITVSGFVSTLNSVRSKGAEQFFFVNGRFMKHPYFHKAVLNAYENLVADGMQPSYFLFFQVPQDKIDVNIHPAKTEIRFEDESVIWKIVLSAVRQAVGQFEEMPTIDFNTADMPDIPVYDNSRVPTQPKVQYNPDYNPFQKSYQDVDIRQQSNNQNWSTLYDDVLNGKLNESPLQYSLDLPSAEESVQICPLQFRRRFILYQTDNGLMIVDQHRAHLRILYERYLREAKTHTAASQGVLFPEMFQLSPTHTALFEDLKPIFAQLGFDISDMGHGAIAVQGIPSGLEDQDMESLVRDMIDELALNPSQEYMRQMESMALAMARKSAIPAGRELSVKEMQELISDLEKCENRTRTPDARNILVLKSDEDMTKAFD